VAVASNPDAKPASAQVARWREKVVDAAVLSVPLALISNASTWIQASYFDEPWKVLWIVAPLIAAAWLTWYLLRQPGAARLDWRLAVFLSIYGSVFALASATDLLVWKRMPQGYEAASRGWILPVTLGDWHYWFPRQAPAQPKGPVVILVEHSEAATREERRWQDRRMVLLAHTGGATGVAFDVAFNGPSLVDARFCDEVQRSGLTVLSAYAYTFEPVLKEYVPTPAEQQLSCLPLKNQGHAMSLAESDRRVRMIPLYWDGNAGAPALSLRVARAILGEGAKLPGPGAPPLRFLERPAEEQGIYFPEQLEALERNPSVLKDRFVLVGERSDTDTFQTPFGPLPGTVIHAFAVDSLLRNHFLIRPPPWVSAFAVFAACYVLALFASQRRTARSLAIVAAVISAAVVVAAAGVVFLFNVWLDVIYVIVATWLLWPLLLVYRSLASRRAD